MVLVEAITRLIPGAIKEESLKEESLKMNADKKSVVYEYPQYSRPAIFYPDKKNKKIKWSVPKVLLSGNHQKLNSGKRSI